MDIESIGDDGDEATHARCREAIELPAQLEPDLFHTYRSTTRAPEWQAKPPGEKL